jgi:6-phosphogluconolactonase
MPLHIYKDSQSLSLDCAQWISAYMADILQKKDRFTWVLSGGNTPKGLYELLAASPFREKIQWRKLHLFWGDERAVPFNDPRNNAKMAYDNLLNHVPVPASQIHTMRTDIPPEQSAEEYEKILHQYFTASPPSPGTHPGQHSVADLSLPAEPSFDLVLLGMGDDGHTLSLFPGTEAVNEEKAWVLSYFLQAQEMHRITLTKTIVNRSSRIAFLVTGPDKARALEQVLEGDPDPNLYPSQVIRPEPGELHWFIDEAAASGLSKR